MVYTFNDIKNTEVEESSQVLFICGTYSIFNYIVENRCRTLCKGELRYDLSDLTEFDAVDTGGSWENLSFDDFLIYSKGRKLLGKWFCSVDYSNLSKKQQEQINAYIKRPSEFSLLVVLVTDWKLIKKLKANKQFLNSKVINLIDLSWPNRKGLIEVLSDMFAVRGVKVEKKALELFIMRLGRQYGDYQEQIDIICAGNGGNEINYSMMLGYLDGVVNYAIDDFVRSILKPVRKDEIYKNRKVYKVLNTLIDDVGVKSLVWKLKSRVALYIEYRLNINNGNIPILVPYSVKAVQEKLPKDSVIKRVGEESFRINAEIASLTTIKDWYYIKMLLDSVSIRSTDEECLRVLFAVIHRGVYSTDKMLNLVGLKDVLNEGLYGVDTCKCVDDIMASNGSNNRVNGD